MAHEDYDLGRLVPLRKQTRVIAEVLRARMVGYLATLTPLFRPRGVLGDYVKGATHEPVRGAEKALKDLESAFDAVVSSPPFYLRAKLATPIELGDTTLEVSPLEYAYVVSAEGQDQEVTVRCPTQWVLSYAGLPLSRLRELLEVRQRQADEIQRFIIHYLVMHVVLENQAGLRSVLADLRFPVVTRELAEFGGLPITCIAAPVATSRPPDSVIHRSVAISGMSAFEEIAHLSNIGAIRDPVKEELLGVAGPEAGAIGTDASSS